MGFFDAGFQKKNMRVSEFLWLGVSGPSKKVMAETLQTPKKAGRPKVKKDRPTPYAGFDGFTSVNNFVRGAIWLLHQQGKSNRDIEVALHVNHTTVGDVIQQCENGDFLKEESPQPKALPQDVVERRKLVAKLHKKDKLASSSTCGNKMARQRTAPDLSSTG